MNDKPSIDQHSEERKNRIRLSLAAYGYEVANKPIMSDHEFDSLAAKINPNEQTWEEYHTPEYKRKCKEIDKFFHEEFSKDTGQWIHKHPYFDEIAGHFYWFYGDK